ncbi:MAG: hypothetical protein HKN29_00795 [Rhodothermales bacterium]|nr:hypothetical protein [Rhodothermales bacterium]
MRNSPIVLAILILSTGCTPPDTRSAAEQLVDRSIAFHDPDGHWYGRAHRIDLGEKRPDGFVRMTSMRLDPVANSFGVRQDRGEDVVEGYLDPENCAATVNGVIPDSTHTQRYRLGCPDGLAWWREYYAFMHGMPMKLKDDGTVIHPSVTDTTFLDKPVQQIKVTYDPEVGSDIWYFYFDPETAEMVGSRFYHDEAANDGEYIDYDGLVEADGMRLTRSIHWYTNSEGRYLGTDSLMTYAAD